MSTGSFDGPVHPTPGEGIANVRRLEALGEAINRQRDEAQGRRPITPRAGRATNASGSGGGRGRARRRRRRLILAGVAVVIVIGGVLGGGYLYGYYLFSKVHKVNVAGEVNTVSGQPFNILEFGSDSRAGLTGVAAAQTGASSGAVTGQRSDVIKIMHIDPAAGTITVLSIPRDTVVSMLPQSVAHGYGHFNRLNTTLFTNTPSLLAQTITANFGIPIAHTIEVSFAGLINATSAIGGVKMYFPYPAKDALSGLNIPHAGCLTINNNAALELTRSRHYEWFEGGIWRYDFTSDFGRIYRQNEFIKAMIDKAKALYNPATIASFLSKVPSGVTMDSKFTYNDLLSLAYHFHSFNISSMSNFTLSTYPGQGHGLGDYLTVTQPTTQQQLVKIFGSELTQPTLPPPNAEFQTLAPPVVTAAVTTKKSSSASVTVHEAAATSSAPVTTTTVEGDQWFDPYPC